MGSESSKESSHKITKQNSKLKHPILQFAQLIQYNNAGNDNGQNTDELQLTITVPNRQIYTSWESNIKKYRTANTNDSQIIFLPKTIVYQDNGICGTGGLIKARYNAPPLMLSQELQNRIQIMQPFSQAEIWYIFYILICAASQLHSRKLAVGDIRPNNIFLYEDGQISVGCNASFLQQTPNFIKTLRNKQRTFLAPQQIYQLQNRKIQSKYSIQSQNFSIGLTMLSLMILHDQSDLYYSNNVLFDEQQFRKDLEILANCGIYSDELKKLVFSLLQQSMQQRTTSVQMYKIIKPYQYKITNFQPFQIELQYLNVKSEQKLNKINFNDYNFISSSLAEHSRLLNQSFIKKSLKYNDSNELSYQRPTIRIKTNQKTDANGQQLLIVQGDQYNRIFQPSNYEASVNNPNFNEKAIKPIQMKYSRDNSSFNQYGNQKLKINVNYPEDRRSVYGQKGRYVRQHKASKSVDIDQIDLAYKDAKFNLQKKVRTNGEADSNYDNSQERDIINSQKNKFSRHRQVNTNKISFSKTNQDTSINEALNYYPFKDQKGTGVQIGNNITENSSEKLKKDPLKLQQMGKLTKSIRNLSQYNRQANPINYQQMLRAIDQKVSQSKQMFPSPQ